MNVFHKAQISQEKEQHDIVGRAKDLDLLSLYGLIILYKFKIEMK